jgi:hypothetical protein
MSDDTQGVDSLWGHGRGRWHWLGEGTDEPPCWEAVPAKITEHSPRIVNRRGEPATGLAGLKVNAPLFPQSSFHVPEKFATLLDAVLFTT